MEPERAEAARDQDCPVQADGGGRHGLCRKRRNACEARHVPLSATPRDLGFVVRRPELAHHDAGDIAIPLDVDERAAQLRVLEHHDAPKTPERRASHGHRFVSPRRNCACRDPHDTRRRCSAS